MRKKICSLPVSEETHELVRKKQIELTPKRNKSITLIELSNELILKGINALNREDDPIETTILVEGKPYTTKGFEGFKLGKDEVKQNEPDVGKV